MWFLENNLKKITDHHKANFTRFKKNGLVGQAHNEIGESDQRNEKSVNDEKL